jgi:uncharacterized protein YoxC
MDSMLNPKQTDSHDVAIAAIKEAYQQLGHADIGHADKRLPRANEQVSRLEQDAVRHPSDQQQRPAVPDRRSSRGRLALKGLIGLLMAACIGAAAVALRSYGDGDTAKQMIARWAPQPGLSSSPAPENPVPTQPSPPAVQAAAANAAPPQPANPVPVAQTAPEGAVPTAAAAPPGQEQPLQSVARDLAAVEQEIGQLKASIEQLKTSNEQLKASKEQIVRDNAGLAEQLKAVQAQVARDNENAAEQLKASQEQMARLIAKASEQNLPPKITALPARPIARPTPKPVPKLASPPQARAASPPQARAASPPPQARARPLTPIQ